MLPEKKIQGKEKKKEKKKSGKGSERKFASAFFSQGDSCSSGEIRGRIEMVIREMRGMSGISILEISSQPCECPVNSSKVHSKNVSVSSP